VDREERSPISAALGTALQERVRAEMEDADAILFSDYSKGVLTQQVVREVLRLASVLGKPAFANPKPASVLHYRGVDLLTLNQSEAEAVTQCSLAEMDAVQEAGAQLLRLSEAEAAVITLGGRGLALFQAGEAWRHLPVVPLEVYDPCGCGDSAIAAATLARAAGASWVEAATLANLAGTAKVRKLGVVPVNRQEIEDVLAASSLSPGPANGSNGSNGHGLPEPSRGLGLPLPLQARRRG
jgi:D-beta-D-heptose 7-phosphate kinase/D-beta-D-heptose 1-phosphate adenosyltransferase